MFARFTALHHSIQTRLLIAVTLLALATMLIGLTSLYWLNRSNTILSDLHSVTLEQVNRSHELTRQSSVFATSVPFFLNLRSSYLIKSEGNKLLDLIDSSIDVWQQDVKANSIQNTQTIEIENTLQKLRISMVELVAVVENLTAVEDQTRRYTTELSSLSKTIQTQKSRLNSFEELSAAAHAEVISSLLFAASHANSFLSLGEYRRQYLKKTENQYWKDPNSTFHDAFKSMHQLAVGNGGLFVSRYAVLQQNIATRRALNSVSGTVNSLSEQVLDVIQRSEHDIANRRETTTASLTRAIVLIAIVSLASILLAIFSAVYIAGYVIRNLNTVTTAMTALAEGNLSSPLPAIDQSSNEIGRLQAALSVFQKNAFSLNRTISLLEQKTAQFESTFNNINDGVAITNPSGLVLAKNPRLNDLLRLFGHEYEVSVGSSLYSKVSNVFAMTGHSMTTLKHTGYSDLQNSLGQMVEVRLSPLPDGGHVWLFSDTTERRRVEEKLRHFQRLESLGQLTGEVAHDVNNVLSAIQTTIPRVISRREDADLHHAAVNRISDAVDLGSSLTQRLLAFARRQQLKPKTVELNELVAGVGDLISLSLGEAIEFVVTECTQSIHVTIDPLQLESALLNLCLNSAKAIDGQGKVTITVSLLQNTLASIEVRDTGSGMTEEVARRAIEPFFTTQSGGNGSGLGLSIVYGFIKQSGGDLHIDSAPGDGTRITLTIPINDSAFSPVSPISSNSYGGYKILIVEDNLELLDQAISSLSILGALIMKATEAETAMRLIESEDDCALLFTDVQLGSTATGWEVARHFLEHHPNGNIIITSGRFHRNDPPPSDLQNKIRLLQKPYTEEELIELVQTNLELT